MNRHDETPPTPSRPPAADPRRRALGRGLGALLPSPLPQPETTAAAAVAPPPGSSVLHLRLEQIQPNPLQPRRHFAPGPLQELADSLRAQGVLQPILVRPSGSGYEIIAGERRFRAAQLAGLQEIPALVGAYGEERALEAALVENLQREDLNPIEQARAFLELGQRFRLTQEQIAQRTGKERASVANYIRLLRLDPEVVAMIEAGELSLGQARPLLALDPPQQPVLARQIVAQGWSARRVEEHVAALQAPPAPKPAKPTDPNVREAESQLARALGTRVHIRAGRKNRGLITLEYQNLDEFQRIYDQLVKPVS